MTHMKKLIEVALPLDAINKACCPRRRCIRNRTIIQRGLHLWWARRPLAAARAVIFAQMVDDPSEYVDVLLSDPKQKRAAERELKKRLAAHAAKRSLARDDADAEAQPMLEEIIAEQEREPIVRHYSKKLVLWENTTNEEVLEPARREIWQSWRRACAENAAQPRAAEIFDRHKLPAFHDPFAGRWSAPAGGAAAGTRSACERPEPGGGVGQQSHDRNSTEICRPGACESGVSPGKETDRARLDWGAGSGRRRALLRPMDA